MCSHVSAIVLIKIIDHTLRRTPLSYDDVSNHAGTQALSWLVAMVVSNVGYTGTIVLITIHYQTNELPINHNHFLIICMASL